MSPVEEDSQNLIAKIVQKDKAAFGRFYDRFSPLAYSFALRILRSREEAQDLIQEVFLQAWNQADRYDLRRGKPEAWIITMTKSRAIDKLRSRRRKEQGVPVFEEAARLKTEESENFAIHAEWKMTLEGALKDLSEIQRTALEMAYMEGKTQTEIAEELGIPVGTIKTRIRDGLMKLRENFGKAAS